MIDGVIIGIADVETSENFNGEGGIVVTSGGVENA